MNSTFLRILAVLMVIAAIVTALIGYRLSHQKSAENLAVVLPTYSQVVAHQDLAIGHRLSLEDMETITTPQQDSETYTTPLELQGKITRTPVVKGVAFRPIHFFEASAISETLSPDERAVAIKVNEVIGVGGFIKPGDHVDVLLYLRNDRQTGEVSSAQVALSNVKVLAYGTQTGETDIRQQRASVVEQVPGNIGKNQSTFDTTSDKESRSAILAVKSDDVSKLMLADSTGVLRLALRGAALPESAAAKEADNQFIRLEEVSRPIGKQALHHASQHHTASSVPAPKKQDAPTPKREQVIVHQGEKMEITNVAK